jgi:hypothetical protein
VNNSSLASLSFNGALDFAAMGRNSANDSCSNAKHGLYGCGTGLDNTSCSLLSLSLLNLYYRTVFSRVTGLDWSLYDADTIYYIVELLNSGVTFT